MQTSTSSFETCCPQQVRVGHPINGSETDDHSLSADRYQRRCNTRKIFRRGMVRYNIRSRFLEPSSTGFKQPRLKTGPKMSICVCLIAAFLSSLTLQLTWACSFVYGANARSPLKISRRMMIRILSYHQVMPNYLDFISASGFSELPQEIRFSGFREQLVLNKAQQCYQLCYNLKSPGRYTDPTDLQRRPWTIRQAGVHHQFNVKDGNTLWIVNKGDLEIKYRIQDMTGATGRKEDRSFDTPAECFASSLAVHLLMCDWSSEQWRSCLKSLEDSLHEEASQVALPCYTLSQQLTDSDTPSCRGSSYSKGGLSSLYI